MSESDNCQVSFSSWIDIGNARHIRDALERRVASEHQQIATRIGWLVTANSFLFAPVAILYSNGPSNSEQLELIWLACAIGLAMSVITLMNVGLALMTMNKAKQHERLFLDSLMQREDRKRYYEFLFCSIDVGKDELECYAKEDVIAWPKKRSWWIHPLSMALQVFIPVILIIVWGIILWMYFNTDIVTPTDSDSQSQRAVVSEAFPGTSQEELVKEIRDLREQLGTLQASLSNTEEPPNQSHKMKKPVSEGN